ncbi:hypothetical protein LIER_32340 [Lithospermum erythrorhizon]|uniref:Uncharacterized protein n=1 Tax=Lithospermum erythrorhizon TaxID=34254 RepID=A0AAV3RXG5_LITER
MDKDLNLQDRPGVSTQARSTLSPLDKRGELIAPNKGPSKTPSHGTSPNGIHNSLIQLSEHASESQRSPDRRRLADRRKAKVHDDEVSSNSNCAPPKTGGKDKHAYRHREQSLSKDSHTREPSYRLGYDLTSSDSLPERSPIRDNRPVHKGKVTCHSTSHHCDKLDKGHRRDKVHTPPGSSAMRDVGGSSHADLQKQVDKLKGSPKKGSVWDRLQNPKDNLSLKRPRLRSPQRDYARELRRYPDPAGSQYNPLKVLVGRIYAQIEDKKFHPRPQRIKAPPHRMDL